MDNKQHQSRGILDITLANLFSNPNYQQSYVFYAHMLGQCSIILENMPASAAVSFHIDHYRLHINTNLFSKFSLEERMFILFHEMMHILNGHVGRLEDRNHKAFNYATDCAINQLGNKNHMPQGCIVPANYPSKHKVPDGLSAEQYYELLDKDQMQEEPEYLSGGGHDKWEESEGDADLQGDITKNMIEKAISQTQKSRGDIPSEIAKYLDLFTRKAELDWKKVLRGITGNKKVNTRKTILRKDRRNPDFDHLKGTVKDRMFDLLVIGDESGSVSDDALLTGINESLHICKVTKTPLWYIAVDTNPSEPKQLKQNIKTFNRTHYGGTYLSPALEKAKNSKIPYKAIVIITDGELDSKDVRNFTDLHIPIIWLIEPTGTVMSEMNTGRSRAYKLTKQ